MYSDARRATALARFRDVRPEMTSDRAAYGKVAEALGLNPDTVRRWVKADARATHTPPPARVLGEQLTAKSARSEFNHCGEEMVRATQIYVDAIQRAIDSSTYADATVDDLHEAFATMTGSRPRLSSSTELDSAVLRVQAAAQLKTTATHVAFLDEMMTHMIYVAHRAEIPVWDIAAAMGLTVSKVRHRIDKRTKQLDDLR